MENKENAKTECPSRWHLIQFVAGEYTGDGELMQRHLASCHRCRQEAERLESQRARFLEHHPPEIALAPLLERGRQGRWPAWRFAAAAACLAVALVAVFLFRGEPAERVKGSWSVQVYLLRHGKVSRAESGQEFFPGDRIQFTYTTPRAGYLFFVSVDSRGRVFSFNPGGAETSLEIAPGSEKAVEGSIELDDSVGPERVFAVFSERPLRLEDLGRAIAADLARAGGVEGLSRLSLEHPHSSFLMLKRPSAAAR